MSENPEDKTGEPDVKPAEGPKPGERRKRRESLNTEGGNNGTPPIGSNLDPPPASTEDSNGELEHTKKDELPPSQVWGLRVSEQHYDTGTTMLNVLAARFGINKRQAGELIVQFLVANRFTLFEYVKTKTGPGIDLDFFLRPEPQEASTGE